MEGVGGGGNDYYSGDGGDGGDGSNQRIVFAGDATFRYNSDGAIFMNSIGGAGGRGMDGYIDDYFYGVRRSDGGNGGNGGNGAGGGSDSCCLAGGGGGGVTGATGAVGASPVAHAPNSAAAMTAVNTR